MSEHNRELTAEEKIKKSLFLYAVTDRKYLNGRSLAWAVEEAIKGGATMVQLREKNLAAGEFEAEAREIGAICRAYRVPLLINDDVNLAARVDADGAHIGQSDMTAKEARKILGAGKILGVSAVTVEQAKEAEAAGADYLGVGAMFATSTKADADLVTLAVLREICVAVTIPVVAIGGITHDNIAQLKGSGIVGVAVVSAIFAADNIRAATAKLREKCVEFLG